MPMPLSQEERDVILMYYKTHSDALIAKMIDKCERTIYMHRKRNGLTRDGYPKVSGRTGRDVKGRFASKDLPEPYEEQARMLQGLLSTRWDNMIFLQAGA